MENMEHGNRDAYKILESEEFNSLLDAVELMAKAQGSLLSLQKSVSELREMVENNSIYDADLSVKENAEICCISNELENLVDDLAYDD